MYEPYLIANQRVGLELDIEPWLLPPDAYSLLQNWYLYQGRLCKRGGYTLFGKMVHHVASEAYGTGDGATKTFLHTLAEKPLRPGDLSVTDEVETFTDNGDGTLTGDLGGTGTINYTSGACSVTFHTAPLNLAAITAEYDYYPDLPVMGLFNYSNNVGNQQLLAFNTRRANYWNTVQNKWIDLSGTDIWTGDETNFFWLENWQNKAYICNSKDQLYVYNGTNLTPFVIDTVNSKVFIGGESIGTGNGVIKTFTGNLAHTLIVSGSLSVTDGNEHFSDGGDGTLIGDKNGTGTINYTTGAYSVTFMTAPANLATISANYYYNSVSGSNHVTGCCFIVIYKNRMILFRPTEDGLDKNQRIRWCEVGNPNSWPSSYWLDADGSAFLTMGSWLSDNIIGFFDRGVRVLQYLGDPRMPFYWKGIASNEGLLASMSPMELEDEIFFLSITHVAGTDGSQVYYLDQKIPTFITTMRQAFIQFCYSGFYEPMDQLWLTFPSLNAPDNQCDQILVYNINDNAFSTFVLPMVCFGYFERGSDWIWADFTYNWSQATWKWNARNLQAGYATLIGGDYHGNVYTMDNGATDNGALINAQALTAKLNPFVKQGMKARLGWLEILVDTNLDENLQVDLYKDTQALPYASYQVPMDDGRGQEKSWLRVPSGVAGDFHHIGLKHNGNGGVAIIHALIPYFDQAGPIR